MADEMEYNLVPFCLFSFSENTFLDRWKSHSGRDVGRFSYPQTSNSFTRTLHNLPRSLKYKLPDSLRLHPAQAITLRTSARVQG